MTFTNLVYPFLIIIFDQETFKISLERDLFWKVCRVVYVEGNERQPFVGDCAEQWRKSFKEIKHFHYMYITNMTAP